MSMISLPIPLASARAWWFTEYPSASMARRTRSRVSERTFDPKFSTRATVTRATPAARATSSIVEFRFFARAGGQALVAAASPIADSASLRDRTHAYGLELDDLILI